MSNCERTGSPLGDSAVHINAWSGPECSDFRCENSAFVCIPFLVADCRGRTWRRLAANMAWWQHFFSTWSMCHWTFDGPAQKSRLCGFVLVKESKTWHIMTLWKYDGDAMGASRRAGAHSSCHGELRVVLGGDGNRARCCWNLTFEIWLITSFLIYEIFIDILEMC